MSSTFRRVPFIQSPLGSGKEHPRDDEHPQIEAHDTTLFENPQFQHYEETSNIQLFFDLFFVANLSCFTEHNGVNSTAKLQTYIGFFCILWFTWCQVTMYDVRFSTDSVFERVAHLCHFGVMVGLATIGPRFDDPLRVPWAILQQLSLLLMGSRIVLFFQYSSTLYFSWRYRTTRYPLIAVLISLLAAIGLYLGLSFVFLKESETYKYAYVAWYVMAVFEVGANIAIAGRWHVLSFKGTHLTERMTCLTLIILGEGVLGLTKSIINIENLDYNFSPGTIGSLISAVLVIYLVYQLYFDNVQLEHFGIMRQQIWTFLHFPFHMALVLLMEGINQFVSWGHIAEYARREMRQLVKPDRNQSDEEYLSLWNNTINYILYDTKLPITQAAYLNITTEFSKLSNPDVIMDDRVLAIDRILLQLLRIIFDGYGFEPPKGEAASDNVEDFLNGYQRLFDLVFGYFFISAGVVLIFIGILSWLSHSKAMNEARSHSFGIVSKFVLGTGLVLCSTMVLTEAASELASTPWVVPFMFFVLAIALILNHIPWRKPAKSDLLLPDNASKPKTLQWAILGRLKSEKQSV